MFKTRFKLSTPNIHTHIDNIFFKYFHNIYYASIFEYFQ